MRRNTSTHLVSSACCSKHTPMFSNLTPWKGFGCSKYTALLLPWQVLRKGSLPTVPNAGTRDCSTFPAHRWFQELTGVPSILQEGLKASPPSSLPALLHHSKSMVAKKIGTGLMDHRSWEAKRSRGRTVGPTRRERVITRFSFYQRTGTFLPWAA